MCYFTGVRLKKADFIRLKELEKSIGDYPFLNHDLLNGFDYGPAAVLKKKEDQRNFEIVQMEWGFLPAYVQSREKANAFRMGYKKANGQWQPPIITLNARGEELLLPGKMFREAALQRRCLLLSTGFFEWRHVFPLHKKTGKPLKTAAKYPYHIGLKEHEYFFMAAIWQPWKDVQTGEYVETFSIVTTEANELMAQVHNSKRRMPSILTTDLAWEWLMEPLEENRISEIACFQIPADKMEACTIAKDFREALDPREKFEYRDLPALI